MFDAVVGLSCIHVNGISLAGMAYNCLDWTRIRDGGLRCRTRDVSAVWGCGVVLSYGSQNTSSNQGEAEG